MLDARAMYGKTLHYLRMKVRTLSSGPVNQAHLDDIIGGIHALTPCAWFKCMETDSLEWMRHTRAILKIPEAYGWDAINPATVRSFYYNWKYRAFFDSLSQRTQISFPSPSPSMDGLFNSSTFLTDYALGVPGLLCRSDQTFRASKSGTVSRCTVLRLLTEIEACVSKLKLCNLQWIKSFPPKPHYKTVSTRNFKAFRTLCGDLADVFPIAYDFSHPLHEGDLRVLCMCLLNLDQAIMNIHQAFPDFCTGEQLELQLRAAEYDAATCAADLCMLIPWITQPQNMSFASIHAQMPLYYASRYYRSQGKRRQLAWCRKVLQNLSAKYGIEIRYSAEEEREIDLS